MCKYIKKINVVQTVFRIRSLLSYLYSKTKVDLISPEDAPTSIS